MEVQLAETAPEPDGRTCYLTPSPLGLLFNILPQSAQPDEVDVGVLVPVGFVLGSDQE